MDACVIHQIFMEVYANLSINAEQVQTRQNHKESWEWGIQLYSIPSHLRKLGVFLAPNEIEEREGAFLAWYVKPRSKKGRFFHFWYRLGFKMRRAPQSAPFDIFQKNSTFNENSQLSFQYKAPPCVWGAKTDWNWKVWVFSFLLNKKLDPYL